MLEFLIDNIYIRVGKEIFRQQVGIPMGTDCAPFLADLFLFYFEYNYMKDLIKSNIHLAKQFSYTTRYIDDLLTLNNNRFFKDFADRHYKLTTRLIQQGFWYTKLCFNFKKFYRIHAPIFSKFNCSVRKHIEEGICLLVNVRLGLTRNVTIRRARH